MTSQFATTPAMAAVRAVVVRAVVKVVVVRAVVKVVAVKAVVKVVAVKAVVRVVAVKAVVEVVAVKAVVRVVAVRVAAVRAFAVRAVAAEDVKLPRRPRVPISALPARSSSPACPPRGKIYDPREEGEEWVSCRSERSRIDLPTTT